MIHRYLRSSFPARAFYTAAALFSALCFAPGRAQGQSTGAEKGSDVTHQMSSAFESLVKRVSPAVVEVLVTGYGSADEDDEHASRAVGRERSLGSGVIIEPDGYIVTNYHVVKGADRVRVVLTPADNQDSQPRALLKSHGRTLPARIVGVSKQIDLAVLKVEAAGLPTLPIGRYDRIHKGQLVLAFGSPEGLENSVALGLVSSVLRQPDRDNPMVYIQTDAAINPGNSGGPLVDVDGNVVGIDTFIYTKSGGNEGIGFAIPSGIVRYAYQQIRQYGRVRRRSIGADLQSLTPDLAQALGLSIELGVIISDVVPGSPAERAGLKIQDVIVGLDGFPVDNVPLFALGLYLLNNGNSAKLQIVRDAKKLDLTVPIFEPRTDPQRLSDLGDPTKGLVPRLGIVGVTTSPEVLDLLGELRIASGVLVTSIVDDRLAVDSGLMEGDVIHTLNRTQITSVDGLRAAFGKLQPGEAAAMQVERNGKLTYVTFDME
jgi:serine protease Do